MGLFEEVPGAEKCASRRKQNLVSLRREGVVTGGQGTQGGGVRGATGSHGRQVCINDLSAAKTRMPKALRLAEQMLKAHTENLSFEKEKINIPQSSSLSVNISSGPRGR